MCPGIQGSFADEQHPLAAQGPWLQMYLSYEHIDTLLTDLSVLDNKVCIVYLFLWHLLRALPIGGSTYHIHVACPQHHCYCAPQSVDLSFIDCYYATKCHFMIAL